MLYATLSIIPQYVPAPKASLEMRSLFVTSNPNQVCVRGHCFRTVFMNYFSVEPVKDDPCNPSPCGLNSQCNAGTCTCLPEYHGDPYRECRPECVLNNDCPRNKACVSRKCVDPCPGTCGINAECSVYNHVPMCTCTQGFIGNAFVQCNRIQGTRFKTK